MADRKQDEIQFHNERERDRAVLDSDTFERKYSNLRWYAVVRKSQEYFANWVAANCRGKRVLDYCCGHGDVTLALAAAGAFVTAIDISDESVRTTQRKVNQAGASTHVDVAVMDAERLAFSKGQFDKIVCSGVLHHLDLENAYRELRRVLKPTGTIICIEALGHNPVFALYRRMTPRLRTAWEADHIVKINDIRLARQWFERVDVRFFHLFSILAVPFRRHPWFPAILSTLEACDDLVLRIPYVNLLAWQVVFELRGLRRE